MSESTGEHPDALIQAEEPHAPSDAREEDEAASSDEWIDSDVLVTEVAAALSPETGESVYRSPKKERIRFGPLTLPMGVIAWAGSLMLHGGIVAGAVLIASMITLRVPPTIAFAQGDGSAEVGLRSDASGVESGAIVLPPSDRDDVSSESARPVGSEGGEDVPEPTFDGPTVTPPADVEDGGAVTEKDMLIGIVSSEPVAPNLRRLSKGAPVAPSFAAPASSAVAPSADRAVKRTSTAVTAAAPAGHGGAGSNRGTPGVANGFDSRGVAVPIYPVESLRRKEQGIVVLSVELNEEGQIVAVRVEKDPGYPRLIKAAIDAVRATPFTPATEDGRAIASITNIPFRFSLR